MKKVLLGFLSIIFAMQVSFAQPISDMAVIPMGITIQSIMRLQITKGGNMEFVFKNAADLTTGLPGGAFSSTYETTGTITASQNWDLEMIADAATFIGDPAGTIALNVMEIDVSATPGSGAGTNYTAIGNVAIPAANTLLELIINNGGNRDSNVGFTIQWACGSSLATVPGVGIPVTTAAGRYTVNFILSLVATNH